MPPTLTPYQQATPTINWHHPTILKQAQQLATPNNPTATAKTCFEWVRDEIHHSVDYQMNPVTCRASVVLQHRTGYCYAKSHLLAALLRANGIPAGFCYQRLSINDNGAPYCLHGLNALYLPDFGWYRIDPRGNKPGVDAQFSPPKEQLAFTLQFPEETTYSAVLPDPLPVVVNTLETYSTWDEVLHHLPDMPLDQANRHGLTEPATA